MPAAYMQPGRGASRERIDAKQKAKRIVARMRTGVLQSFFFAWKEVLNFERSVRVLDAFLLPDSGLRLAEVFDRVPWERTHEEIQELCAHVGNADFYRDMPQSIMYELAQQMRLVVLSDTSSLPRAPRDHSQLFTAACGSIELLTGDPTLLLKREKSAESKPAGARPPPAASPPAATPTSSLTPRSNGQDSVCDEEEGALKAETSLAVVGSGSQHVGTLPLLSVPDFDGFRSVRVTLDDAENDPAPEAADPTDLDESTLRDLKEKLRSAKDTPAAAPGAGGRMAVAALLAGKADKPEAAPPGGLDDALLVGRSMKLVSPDESFAGCHLLRSRRDLGALPCTPPRMLAAFAAPGTVAAVFHVARPDFEAAMHRWHMERIKEYVSHCCRLPFLRHCPLHNMFDMAKWMTLDRKAAGDTLLQQGFECPYLFFLLEGTVDVVMEVKPQRAAPAEAHFQQLTSSAGFIKVITAGGPGPATLQPALTRTTTHGRMEGGANPFRVVLATRGPGSLLGDDILREKRLSVSVQAATPCVCLKLPANLFRPDGLTHSLIMQLRTQWTYMRVLREEACNSETIIDLHEDLRQSALRKAFGSPQLPPTLIQTVGEDSTRPLWIPPSRTVAHNEPRAAVAAPPPPPPEYGLSITPHLWRSIIAGGRTWVQAPTASDRKEGDPHHAPARSSAMLDDAGPGIDTHRFIDEVGCRARSQSCTEMVGQGVVMAVEVDVMDGQGDPPPGTFSDTLDSVCTTWMIMAREAGCELHRWGATTYLVVGGAAREAAPSAAGAVADVALKMHAELDAMVSHFDLPKCYFAAGIELGVVFLHFSGGRFLESMSGRAVDAAAAMCAHSRDHHPGGSIMCSDSVAAVVAAQHDVVPDGLGYRILRDSDVHDKPEELIRFKKSTHLQQLTEAFLREPTASQPAPPQAADADAGRAPSTTHGGAIDLAELQRRARLPLPAGDGDHHSPVGGAEARKSVGWGASSAGSPPGSAPGRHRPSLTFLEDKPPTPETPSRAAHSRTLKKHDTISVRRQVRLEVEEVAAAEAKCAAPSPAQLSPRRAPLPRTNRAKTMHRVLAGQVHHGFCASVTKRAAVAAAAAASAPPAKTGATTEGETGDGARSRARTDKAAMKKAPEVREIWMYPHAGGSATSWVASLPVSATRVCCTGAGLPELPSCEHLPHLVSISASYNGLKEVAVSGLTVGLKSLCLVGNSLTQLPPDVGSLLPNLQTLNVSGNAITSLPDSLCFAPDLTSISANHNRLSDLPREFWRLDRLRHVHLSHNSFSHVPECLFAVTALQRLNMSHNDIEAVSDGLSSLVELVELNLGFNQILEFPPVILSSLRNTRSLDLRHNCLRTLHCGAASGGDVMPRLRAIMFSFNQLTEMPEWLPSSLQELYAAHNRLEEVPAWLPQRLRRLRALDLHNNVVHFVCKEVLQHSNLELLGLSRNPIMSHGSSALAAAFHAGTSAQGIVKWMQAQFVTVPAPPAKEPAAAL